MTLGNPDARERTFPRGGGRVAGGCAHQTQRQPPRDNGALRVRVSFSLKIERSRSQKPETRARDLKRPSQCFRIRQVEEIDRSGKSN